MGSSTLGHSGSEVMQFLVHTSSISCGRADMPLQSNSSLKSCKLLKKLQLRICGYTVAEQHSFAAIAVKRICSCNFGSGFFKLRSYDSGHKKNIHKPSSEN
jgi:hypothetical protein